MSKGGKTEHELSKVLAKTMQCSFKRKEVEERIKRIIDKTERIIETKTDQETIRKLRREFEEVRMAYYGL